MTTNASFGSYSFGEFDSNEDELARLEKQAAIAWPLEKAQLLQAGLKKGDRMLDVASGSGAISAKVATHITGDNGHVTGVELNEKLLSIAKDRAHEHLNFVHDDAYELNHIDDNSYDFAYARFLFQHLADPAKALKAILKKLKPGGRFLITEVDDDLVHVTPEPEGLAEFMAMARKAQSGYGGDRYIGRKLGGLMAQNGYEHINIWAAFVTSEMISIHDFYNITTSFKMELIGAEDKDKALECLEHVSDATEATPDTFAAAGVYCVTGQKPDPSA